jgi:hypothetical protein
MTFSKMFQGGKPATPSRHSSGRPGPGGPTGRYTSNEMMTRDDGKVNKSGNPREPKRDESKRISFSGNAMSRPIRGGKIKRY